MSDPVLSIVIPVRGKPNELWFTLQGLLHAGFQDQVEILVVDNDPSQEVREVCEYFSRPILRYIEAGEIKGVNYPRSVGADNARGQWLMMLDSHVLMEPGSYTTILNRIKMNCYPPRSLVHCGVSFGAPAVWGSYRLTDQPKRHCLACEAPFQPKQRRSWFCSRPCADRVSWHRKQARIAEAAALSRDDRQAKYGISNHLTLEDLRLRWRNEPRKNEANYRLWFPDLCGLSPEQALAEREQFQRAFSRHQGQADQRL